MVQVLEAVPKERNLKERFADAFALAGQEATPAVTKQLARSAFAKDIEKESPVMAKLLKSGLPEEDQQKLMAAFKGSDPFKAKQQERLTLDSIANRYSKRIKEIDETLKNPWSTKNLDVKALETQKKKLQKVRDELLGFGELMEEEMDLTPMGEEGKPKEEPKKKEAKGLKMFGKKKVKFNPKDPKHIARKQEVLRKTMGDKQKADEILYKEFDL